MLRSIVAALAVSLIATPALSLEPGELVGSWDTRWANAAGDAPDGGGPMLVRLDSGGESLDGLTPAPGMDGVMNGDVVEENGALVWSGHWASVWPEGATMGTFRLVFTDADHFTGTWSTDDGEIAGAAWIGVRAP